MPTRRAGPERWMAPRLPRSGVVKGERDAPVVLTLAAAGHGDQHARALRAGASRPPQLAGVPCRPRHAALVKQVEIARELLLGVLATLPGQHRQHRPDVDQPDHPVLLLAFAGDDQFVARAQAVEERLRLEPRRPVLGPGEKVDKHGRADPALPHPVDLDGGVTGEHPEQRRVAEQPVLLLEHPDAAGSGSSQQLLGVATGGQVCLLIGIEPIGQRTRLIGEAGGRGVCAGQCLARVTDVPIPRAGQRLAQLAGDRGGGFQRTVHRPLRRGQRFLQGADTAVGGLVHEDLAAIVPIGLRHRHSTPSHRTVRYSTAAVRQSSATRQDWRFYKGHDPGLPQAATVGAVSRQSHWVSPGQSARVAGYDIPGGFIYIGQHLPSAVGTIEPALINPALPLGSHEPDRSGRDCDPSPSYHLMSPDSRAAYLAWLAGGRDRADVPAGFASLFLSGLERRVLVDAADDPALRRELPAIAAEVRRLRASRIPAGNAFNSYAKAFLDVLDLLCAPRWRPGGSPPSGAPPAPHQDRWPVPVALRVALAGFAVTGTPVPADWARSWAWYNPSLFPRTPQTRCPQEFERLFAVRYTRRFAAGLVPQTAARPPIRIGYSPASPGIDAVVLDRPDLPDVLEEPRATRELGALVDSVTDALTPYSRWLARTPGGHGSLASTALLPADLLDLDPGPLRHLLTWANAHLDGQFAAVIDASEFSAFWSTANPAGMSRDEAASLALILARAGLGVEPDVRFGGPALAPGPAVLFRLDREAADAPSPGYLAATTMLHLAAVVALATGARSNSDDIANAIITGLAAEVRLPVTERSRLAARLRWLLASGATLPRPDRRISALTAAEREAAGHFLVSVGTAGPVLAPETVTALTKAYRLLGLDPDLVYRRLHHRSHTGRPGGFRIGSSAQPGGDYPENDRDGGRVDPALEHLHRRRADRERTSGPPRRGRPVPSLRPRPGAQ